MPQPIDPQPIDYGTTALPPEREAALIEQCDEVVRLGRDGNVDEALRLADQVWDALPGADLEQKVLIEVVPQLVTSNAMLAAARAGRRPDAERWLERFNASYGYEDDPTVLTERGEVYTLLGDLQQARQSFGAMLQTYGERAFRDKDPQFLRLARDEKGEGEGEQEAAASASMAGPDAATTAQIMDLAEQGDAQMETGDWQGALRCWQQGIDLVPEPRTAWPPAVWFFGSIADAHWSGEQYPQVVAAAELGLQCGDEGQANPFLWLRIGQAQYELGDRAAALESLTSAFMLGGHEIFEDEDAKYLAFLQDSGIKGL